jgi:hypothetical protein
VDDSRAGESPRTGHPEAEGLYANAFRVDGDEDIVVLEFGYSDADRAQPAHSRIVTSVEHAELLSKTLHSFLRALGNRPDHDDDVAREPAPSGRRTTMEHHEPPRTYGGGGHEHHPKDPPPCDDDQYGPEPEEPPRTPCSEDENGGCTSPTHQVGILQAAYIRAQADLAALTRRQTDFQADVSALQDSAAEQAGIVDTYKTSRRSLMDRKSMLDCWVHEHCKDLECKVDPEDLKKCIGEVKHRVHQWKDYKNILWTRAGAASDKSMEAAKAAADAKDEYEKAKVRAASLDATLGELESLKAQIKTRYDAGEYCEAYILLQELEERLNHFKLPQWKNLEHELCLAWTKYSEKKATARTAKGRADEAQAKYDDWKAFYDSSSTTEKIWEAILHCCCKPKPEEDCKQS